MKSKIDNMQKNSKYKLCGDRDEIINHIISECSKVDKRNIRLGMTESER